MNYHHSITIDKSIKILIAEKSTIFIYQIEFHEGKTSNDCDSIYGKMLNHQIFSIHYSGYVEMIEFNQQKTAYLSSFGALYTVF